jgi:hypothetical protein
VQVVVDVDLPVAAAADENQPVDLDRATGGDRLDGVPVVLGGVGIGVGRDLHIDRRVAVI